MSGPGDIVSPLEWSNTVPDTAVVCSNLHINWFGGVPPYVLSYSPTNVPSTVTVIKGGLPSTGFDWQVNALPFSQITLNVVDAVNTAIHSTNLGVQSGIDTSCVNFSSTASSSTTTPARPTSSANTVAPGQTSKQTTTTTASSSSSGSASQISTQSSSSGSSGSSSTSSPIASSGTTSDTTASIPTSSGSTSTGGSLSSASAGASVISGEKSSKTHPGAIAGGVIGGIVVIALLFLFFLIKRRKERKPQDLDDIIDTADHTIVPFKPETSEVSPPASFGNGFVTSGKGQLGSIPVPPISLSSNNKSREAQQVLPVPSSDHQESTTSDGSLSTPAPLSSNPGQQNIALEAPEDEREPRAAGRQVMRHEDSGIRMPVNDDIVELPPLYTPG